MTDRQQNKNELTVAVEKALTSEQFLKQVKLNRNEMIAAWTRPGMTIYSGI